MNYQLTCLTPTLIGNGEELAPIDYMVWKDQINVLDQRRIFKLFARGPRLDGYLAQLKKATKLDFASWGGLAQNYAGRRIAFEHTSLTRHFDRAAAEHLFIRTFSSNSAGAIYVPGTAIKGALRTGTVFAGWNEQSWQSVNAQLNERMPRRLAGPSDERIAGKKFSNVGSSDSAPLPYTNTRVYLTRASTLTGRDSAKLELAWKRAPGGSTKSVEDGTPTFIEMAQPGTVFEGAFRAKDTTHLFRAANQFAAGLLANHANYAETAKLGKLSESISKLIGETEKASETRNTCLLPLGWGGGFLGKAALVDSNTDAMRDVLRKLPFYQRAIQSGLPFPKTRRVVFLNDQPATLAGWMLLTVQS